LEKIADKIEQNSLLKHLYFLVCALISIVLVGYYFGTFDQIIHVPFLKASVDPTLYPNDAFIALKETHYSYFWIFFRPFLRAGVLEIAMFITHILATYLTFWALWRLSKTLFKDNLAAFITTLAFVPPHIFFSGFPIIEFSLLNRTFVLPFLLFALEFYLRRHYTTAFLMLGVLYNLHVVSVNFAMAMVLLASVLEIRRMGWKKLLRGLVLFVVAALPVLIWKGKSSPVDLSLRPEWLDALTDGQIYHLFHLIGPALYAMAIGLINFSSLALVLITYIEMLPAAVGKTSLWQRIKADLKRYISLDNDDPVRTGFIFMAAMLLVILFEEICVYLLPMTIVVQSQILRAGVYLTLLTYIYFARLLAQRYRSAVENRSAFNLLAFSTIVGTVAIWPVVTWLVLKRVQITKRMQLWVGGTMVALLLLSYVIGYVGNLWGPGLYIFGPGNAWQDAQAWAQKNTPKEAVFITPPEIWWMYESDWRVFSERSTVSALDELLEAAFDPAYYEIWKVRFEAIAPGAQAKFTGDFPANISITHDAYYSMTTEQLLKVAKDYGASYLVVEKSYTHNLPVAYENSQYRIYEIPAESLSR